MKSRHNYVRYVSAVKQDEGVKLLEYSTKRIVASKVCRFRNCIHLLAKLTKMERLLLDYLVEEMEEDNSVTNSKHQRERFIEFISDISGIKYSDRSVKNSFLKLKEVGLLISYSKADYYVNPLYYYNGSLESRVVQVRNHIKASIINKNIED